MLLTIKILLSLLAGLLLVAPLFAPDLEGGVFRELALVGPAGAAIAIIVFLALVAAYCVDLQAVLRATPEAKRPARPASVWWMFFIPYNFVEDFFIIHHVSLAIKRRGDSPSAPSFGAITGYGWCACQIVSLIPHPIGAAASLPALILWVWHWLYVRRVLKRWRAQD